MAIASLVQGQERIKFKEFKLDNGLNVIMHQDKTAPLVAVSVLYHVGSKNENPERTGFAHFFEHLLFEGTENIGRGEYMQKVQSIGGMLNAYTTNDHTYYYEVVPSNHLETALYMESERMLHAKIDQIGLETQRQVVKEEKSQRIDNQPYGTIMTEVLQRAYQKHPYNWHTIGSIEHLNAAQLDEFMTFYKTYYVPNNAILTIAGDIDYASTEKMVRKYYSEIAKGTTTIVRPSINEPLRTAEVRDVIYDNIQLPALIQAYPLPKKNDSDMYALKMLSTYLVGGSSALLPKKIVDEKQLAVQMQAMPLELEDGGLFMFVGIGNMGVDIAKLESAVDEQVAALIQNGISDQDFQKLRAQTEMSVVTKNASVEGVAEQLATAKLYNGDANAINTEMQQYDKVTAADIQRVAREYLQKERRVVLHYLPKGAATN